MYTKEAVKTVFRELDLNRDGKITADEFSKKEVDAAIADDSCLQRSRVVACAISTQLSPYARHWAS